MLAGHGDDVEMFALMERIVVAFGEWKEALAAAKLERADAQKLVDGAEAMLAEAIQLGHPPPSEQDESFVPRKLGSIELAWQEVLEARAEAAERKRAAAERVKSLGAAFERAVMDGRQMSLPGM